MHFAVKKAAGINSHPWADVRVPFVAASAAQSPINAICTEKRGLQAKEGSQSEIYLSCGRSTQHKSDGDYLFFFYAGSKTK